MSTGGPVASVVIPAHNEAAVLGRLLDALATGLGGHALEIIVACNGCAQHRIAFGYRSRAAMPSTRPSTQMEYRGGTAGVQHAVAQA